MAPILQQRAHLVVEHTGSLEPVWMALSGQLAHQQRERRVLFAHPFELSVQLRGILGALDDFPVGAQAMNATLARAAAQAARGSRRPRGAHTEERRDPGLSVAAREAVVTAITGDAIAAADRTPRGMAAALRASLDRTSVLSAGERHLLEELLDRIADGD